MAVEVVDEGSWGFDSGESSGMEGNKRAKWKACLGGSGGKQWGGSSGEVSDSGGE